MGYSVQIDGSALVRSSQTWNFQPGTGLLPSPLSTAVVRDTRGRALVAFGMTDGTVRLVDPTVSGANVVASSTASGNGVVAINPIPRIDGSGGADDYAVAEQSGSDVVNTSGALLRYDESDETIGTQEIAAGGGSYLARSDFQSWYPGYKTGRFTLTNNSPEPVTVTLLHRNVSGYGCWYAPPFADGALQFPAAGLALGAGQSGSSQGYVMGAYTASPDGSCQASDASGEWRAYLVVTPTAHPADARVVDLHLNKTLTAGPEVCDPADLETTGVDVCDQVGGSITVSATRQPAQLAAFGLYSITIGGPAAPTPTATPTVTASRLTVPARGANNVYRFDVGPMSWNVPGMTATQPQIQAVLPPLTVQGCVATTSSPCSNSSSDGSTWTGLGSYMPVNKLNSTASTVTVGSPSGGPGATGSGSFFWQNPSTGPAYTHIRVLAGTLPSTPVSLAALQAPPAPTTRITAISVSATKNDNTTAVVDDNGVDQAQLLVTVSAGTTLLPSDPAYASVYYTEGTSLVTNLYTVGSYDGFVGVQPSPGAYPNTGAFSRTRRGASIASNYDYVSSNDAASTTITAHVGSSPGTTVAQFDVDGAEPDVAVQAGVTAAHGFSLEGCADFANGSSTCALAPITPATTSASGRPALYQAGSASSGPLLGAQLLLQAQNSVGSLPLNWKSGGVKENLEPTTPTLTSTLVTMSPNNYLTDDTVDMTLVTHGLSFPVTGLQVGS